MSNSLRNESSPYLLQHADNPVHWYPWGEEAFKKAKEEDKPVFLSIGYSTCHWCHVMAHESFEDEQTAQILNEHFISIKVDKEERPDIDSVYMSVCIEFTGSGGWPTSIFMTAEQKPFFAGTYFPKAARFGVISFKELLLLIVDKWNKDRSYLLSSADKLTESIKSDISREAKADEMLIAQAVDQFKRGFDRRFGGFGRAPKFPMAHNLLFLMQQYLNAKDIEALDMAEISLEKMYRGGLFDHIGYGFSRYSTDPYFLVPHFEKMLYDNALLILAYCSAYDITGKNFYLDVAQKTAAYILREMSSDEGGFYSAQDADSEGEEGKYYVFTPEEIEKLLGSRDGADFNECFDISPKGNFEGKNIPNLLSSSPDNVRRFDRFLPKLREYRKSRSRLHTDDKILTFWNGLMIAAMCALYRSSQEDKYLESAKKAIGFIENKLFCDGALHVSYRQGRLGSKAFLDDYAGCIFAYLALYDVSFESEYLNRAQKLCEKAIELFYDDNQGGFFLYGSSNESLIHRPKECSDGAIPSGNSLMAYNLLRLSMILQRAEFEKLCEQQLQFMASQASHYPAGYSMYLIALSEYLTPPVSITAIKGEDGLNMLPFLVPAGSIVRVYDEENGDYKLLNGRSTFYVCKNNSCLPPVNWQELLTILK